MLPDRSLLIRKKWWIMPKLKISNATFWVIFKQCVSASLLSTENQSWIWWQNIASHWMASNIPHLCFHPHSVWNSHKNVSIEELCQNETCLGIFIPYEIYPHCVWKSSKMSHLNFSIMAFSINFCPIVSDLSGNTVWPQASGFQKPAKIDYFCHF